MRIFSFFILFIFISNISLGFDLRKLGDSLQKDLGGALKELEKGLNQNLKSNEPNNPIKNIQPKNQVTNNDEQWKDEKGNIKCVKNHDAPMCA